MQDMILYLVYEFTHHNYDEDISEEVEFFGLYHTKREAKRVANERIQIGIIAYDVDLAENENKRYPFAKTDCVEMCRTGCPERIIYSICIKELKLKGDKRK